MAKKQEVTEEVIGTESNSSLATLDSALDFLMGEFQETELEQQKRFAIPALKIYMPGKRYTDKGANRGIVIDDGNGAAPEVNIERLRIARVDAPVMQRIMWNFDPKTGKKIQEAEPLPACASSDGVSARKADAFGYIGKEFVDWRDGNKVVIAPDNCKSCPLGQWKELYSGEDWSQPVMDTNQKGVAYHKREKPPCQEQPAYVFYDFDRKKLLVYQVANFTHLQWVMGSNGKFNKRFKGVLKGIEEYYFTAGGTKRPDVMPEAGVILPLVFTTHMVDNSPYGMTPAPKFELGEPLTPQEIAEYATAVQLYKSDNIRSVISGELWGMSESVQSYAEEPAPQGDSPW